MALLSKRALLGFSATLAITRLNGVMTFSVPEVFTPVAR
jgi:hypothetical protein